MPRILVEEQQQTTPPALSIPAEAQAEQLTPVASPKVARKPTGGRGPLRWAIIVFGSVGVFSLMVPTLTGMPLGEWLQGANFKAAYSGSNFIFMRGMAALKVNNLAGATSALFALNPESNEASDLAKDLFPRVMAARDYETALKLNHFMGNTARAYTPAAEIGVAMGKELKLAGALNLLRRSSLPEQSRQVVLPSLFDTVSATELPELVKLIPTLSAQERIPAITSVAMEYAKRKQTDVAWRWSGELPETAKNKLRSSLVIQRMTTDIRWVAEQVKQMPVSADLDSMRSSLASMLAPNDLKTAEQIAQKITPGTNKTIALANLAREAADQNNQKKSLEIIDTIQNSAERTNQLITLAVTSGRQASLGLQILPKIAALVPKDPTLAKTHDELARYLAIATTDLATRESYVAQIRDAELRSTVKWELEANTTHQATLKWNGGTATLQRTGTSFSSSYSGQPITR